MVKSGSVNHETNRDLNITSSCHGDCINFIFCGEYVSELGDTFKALKERGAKQMSEKGYIKYSRPYKHEDDEPPIEEIWTNGDKPKKRLADGQTLYVYDDVDDTFVNERIWDGKA